jgi:hypothetical protein
LKIGKEDLKRRLFEKKFDRKTRSRRSKERLLSVSRIFDASRKLMGKSTFNLAPPPGMCYNLRC